VGGESGDFFFPTNFVICQQKFWEIVGSMCFYGANYSTKICQFWKTFSNFSISEILKKDHIGELLSKAKERKKKKL